jgi:hypothetical protein
MNRWVPGQASCRRSAAGGIPQGLLGRCSRMARCAASATTRPPTSAAPWGPGATASALAAPPLDATPGFNRPLVWRTAWRLGPGPPLPGGPPAAITVLLCLCGMNSLVFSFFWRPETTERAGRGTDDTCRGGPGSRRCAFANSAPGILSGNFPFNSRPGNATIILMGMANLPVLIAPLWALKCTGIGAGARASAIAPKPPALLDNSS